MKHACKNFLYKSVKYSTRILTYTSMYISVNLPLFFSLIFHFRKYFYFTIRTLILHLSFIHRSIQSTTNTTNNRIKFTIEKII